MCANLTWPAATGWCRSVAAPLCRSCSLTRTRPSDGDPALPAFAEAEAAKRRLVVELIELSLPINDRNDDPGARADLRPAVQRARAGDHRARRRRHHA